MAQRGQGSKRMKVNFEELCEKGKIFLFFKRLLNEWKQELHEMLEAKKRTVKGKSMHGLHVQAVRVTSTRYLSSVGRR